eukprot:TRINITY_DN2992_c0_g1_i1.p2 TRINITY_DN2992_c0_g1~~TRINITY_DN2992_c0_g1_i1.p2  ORF type:complete len:203 (+),score=0.14 TRINITY_DN2992_c0_g1_i1:342-950(+)
MFAVRIDDRRDSLMETVDEPIALVNGHLAPLLLDGMLKLRNGLRAVRRDTPIECRPEVFLRVQIWRLGRHSLNLRDHLLQVTETALVGVGGIVVLEIPEAIWIEVSYRRHDGVEVLSVLDRSQPTLENPQTGRTSAADSAEDLDPWRMGRLCPKGQLSAGLYPSGANKFKKEETLLVGECCIIKPVIQMLAAPGQPCPSVTS